jgi:uncharacterized protein YcfJ
MGNQVVGTVVEVVVGTVVIQEITTRLKGVVATVVEEVVGTVVGVEVVEHLVLPSTPTSNGICPSLRCLKRISTWSTHT